MAGVYIHIPFCKKKCYYCDFHTSINLKNKDLLIDALIKEIEIRNNYLKDDVIETIYFGGGTPSILSPNEIFKLLGKIKESYKLSLAPEITLEANPDDLSESYLSDILESGINRLSIGIQSFDDNKLRLMNRRHDALQALNSVYHSRKAGFNNISIDLIYGLPGLNIEDWEKTIKEAINLNIQHISSYHLTYEPKTVFYNHLKKGKLIPLSDEDGYEQFLLLSKITKEAGFNHYEISNFALPGFHSRHNSNYWKQKPYLGLGPSAHSFNGVSRQWNISNNIKYIEKISDGFGFYEKEDLDLKDIFNEYLMTSLRTMEGTSLNYIEDRFGESYVLYVLKNVEELYISGYAIRDDNFIRLTKQGIFISDTIISDLFII